MSVQACGKVCYALNRLDRGHPHLFGHNCKHIVPVTERKRMNETRVSNTMAERLERQVEEWRISESAETLDMAEVGRPMTFLRECRRRESEVRYKNGKTEIA